MGFIRRVCGWRLLAVITPPEVISTQVHAQPGLGAHVPDPYVEMLSAHARLLSPVCVYITIPQALIEAGVGAYISTNNPVS